MNRLCNEDRQILIDFDMYSCTIGSWNSVKKFHLLRD